MTNVILFLFVTVETMSSSSSNPNCCNVFNCTKKDLVKSGFYRTKLFDNIVCSGCGWETGNTKLSIRHINFIHKINNPDCEFSKHVIEDFTDYVRCKKIVTETEELMRETFLMWPKPYPNIETLVQSGFYYIGAEDATACISCGVILTDWNEYDNPIQEHINASPLCTLVRK